MSGSSENSLPAQSSAALDSNPRVRASSQLVSWPVAIQCARDRIRGGPAIVFTGLLALTGLLFGLRNNAASIFGGVTFAHAFLLGMTLILGTALISEELESGHAQLVLLRPVSRAAFFGGRLAGAGLVLLGAMAITWLLACAMALRTQSFTPVYLLALPLAFIWAFAWLAVIGALSSVARGSSNSLWILIGAVMWGALKASLAIGGMMAEAANRWHWINDVKRVVTEVLPYIGPQDPTELLSQLGAGAHADFAPLLYDLLWIAAAWTAGAWLLSKRELAPEARMSRTHPAPLPPALWIATAALAIAYVAYRILG